MKRQAWLLTWVLGGALAGCAPPPNTRMAPPPPAADVPAEPVTAVPPAPTAEDVQAFLDRVEAGLLRRWVAAERAAWVKQTYITHDTGAIAAQAHEEVMKYIGKAATEAVHFDGVRMSEQQRRKLKLLKLSLNLPAPADPKKRAELARIATEMDNLYGKGRHCSPTLAAAYRRLAPRAEPPKDGCLALDQLTEILAKNRNPAHLLDAWVGWRKIARPMKSLYARYVELANEGARGLGFADLGELWRARYEMTPAAFAEEVDRLWNNLRPLYDQLHCYARARLRRRYGKDQVPATGPIPAHLLGNMWSQDWSHIKDLLLPEPRAGGIDLERALKRKKVDAREMVRYAERFFVSLGLDKLPETFWKRSMFVKPTDREVVCHASAWDVDFDSDLRIKMCIRVNGEDFATVHHELGHNYYQYYYRDLSPLLRDSANDGFHEGLGDTISLSVTPSYLQKVGLIEKAPPSELNALMDRALEKIAFLPFGLLMDRWRWEVFSGTIKPEDYTEAWWQLRRRYQGIAPPAPRGGEDFDPGAKYHIPANVPYTRYFLATVLQFQFHRALCKVAGHEGPLHTCSVYGNKKAGARLRAMMELGLSKPWPEALAALSGQRKMDVGAILDYFAPLQRWLKKQNVGQTCGW